MTDTAAETKRDKAVSPAWIAHFALAAIIAFFVVTPYLAQSEVLAVYLDPDSLSLVTLTLNYLCQSVGIVVYIILYIRRFEWASSPRSFGILMALSIVSMALMLLSPDVAWIIGAGIVYNVTMGALQAVYFAILLAYAPPKHEGIAYAAVVGIYNLGIYTITFLTAEFTISQSITVAVLSIFGIIAIVLGKRISIVNAPLPSAAKSADDDSAAPVSKSNVGSTDIRHSLVILVPILILIAFLTTIGNEVYFPYLQISGADYLLSRFFYIPGILIAGFIADKNRIYGLVCMLFSMLFPLLFVALRSEISLAAVLYGAGWFFTGFYMVFIFTTFCDIVSNRARFAVLACLGVLFQRLADPILQPAIGWLWNNQYITLVLMFLLFAILVALSFRLFHKHALLVQAPPSIQDRMERFSDRYQLTQRETDVITLVLDGDMPLKQVASQLSISERMVSRHLTAVYKKTSTTNRSGLVKLFYDE